MAVTSKVNRRQLAKDDRRTQIWQQLQGMDERNGIADKVGDVRKWIATLITPKEELGNHSICPFAAASTVAIMETPLGGVAPLDGCDVAVFIVGECSLEDLQARCRSLNVTYPRYLFLDDHRDDPSYINGVQTNNGKHNLILCQLRDKLLKARENLHKTDYYEYWSEDLYKQIVEG